MYYLVTDKNYETSLKTIQLDHSYSTVKLNNRSKHFPTVFLFKNHVSVFNDRGNEEIDVEEMEESEQQNAYICQKYFDVESSINKLIFFEEHSYVAKLCDKEHEASLLDESDCLVACKKVLQVLKALKLKLKSISVTFNSSPNDATNLQHLAHRSNVIEDFYKIFIRHFLSVHPFRLSWLHESVVRRLDEDGLVAYVSLLQVLCAQKSVLCSSLFRNLRKRMPAVTCDFLHLLLQSPTDIVPQPLQPLLGHVTFILAPDYLSTALLSSRQHNCLRPVRRALRPLGTVHSIQCPHFVCKMLKKRSSYHGVNNNNNDFNDSYEEDANKNFKSLSEEVIMSYMRYVVESVKKKIKEVKEEDTSVVLVCQHNTSLFSFLMKLDDVTAVVCMGLPLSHEHQASLAIKLPTLFVIGQLHCPMTRLEAILKTTHHNTGLVMVGGADEKLTLSEPFKRQHHVTQSMADVLIAHLVRDFISHVIETGNTQ